MVRVRSARAPIVVGVDGSQAALDAVRWAACESRYRNTGLRRVDAVGTMPAPRPGDPRVGVVHRQALLVEAGARRAAPRDVPGRRRPRGRRRLGDGTFAPGAARCVRHTMEMPETRWRGGAWPPLTDRTTLTVAGPDVRTAPGDPTELGSDGRGSRVERA